jgi:ParB family chromosome partitioning protein
MQTIEYIETMNIRSSEINPRKTFDEDSINELAKSIIEVGILQPIIVRLSHFKKGTESYELVCGERRWRAAKVAELSTVPAIIRELKDQEALDLMITENLQRKDVSPLEEAEAFMNLIVHRKYDIPTLVARFGKTESYIRHRLKLNDLIFNFKLLLKHEVIGIGHALEICKLQDKDQEEVYNSKFSETDRSRNWWACPSVKQLKGNIEQQFTLKLDEAAFQLDDTTLDKKAGACITCPKNSASNLILFPDSPSTGVCLDRSCFKHKSDIHFERELKRIQEQEPEVLIGYTSHIYGQDEKDVKELIKKGVPGIEISWSTGFQEVHEPIIPDAPEESDFDTPEEYTEALVEHEGELIDFEQEQKEYKEKLESGNYRKVFILGGNDKGKILLFEQSNKGKSDGSIVKSSPEQFAITQIQELKDKDKRNKELSFEKLYGSVKELFNTSGYNNITDQLSETEMTALFVVMMGRIERELEEEIYGKEKDRHWVANKLKFPAALKLTADQKTRIMRQWLYKNLNNGEPLFQISEAKALIEIAREKYPDQITQSELELDGKYLKRKEKIDQRIAELEASIPKPEKKGKNKANGPEAETKV